MNDLVFNRISKIAKKFNVKLSKIELVDAKLEDGTLIQYETLEIGSDISVISTDGSLTPILDGTYVVEVEDKKYTVVTMNGKIESVSELIEEVEPVTEEVEVEPVTEVPSEEVTVQDVPTDVVPMEPSNVEERLAHVEEICTNLVAVLESMGIQLTEAKEQNIALELKLETIAKSPAKEITIDNSNLTPNVAERIQKHANISKYIK